MKIHRNTSKIGRKSVEHRSKVRRIAWNLMKSGAERRLGWHRRGDAQWRDGERQVPRAGGGHDAPHLPSGRTGHRLQGRTWRGPGQGYSRRFGAKSQSETAVCHCFSQVFPRFFHVFPAFFFHVFLPFLRQALYLKTRMATLESNVMTPVESVCSSAVKTVIDSDCKLIIALTETGHTARVIAKYRPPCPILAPWQA